MKKLILTLAIHFFVIVSMAQLPKLAIVSAETNDPSLNQAELLEFLRMEIIKHKSYVSIDKYEIAEAMTSISVDPKTCYSTSCLTKVGEALNADFALTGSVTKLGSDLFVNLRLVNIESKEQTETVRKFRFIPKELGTMVAITVNDMHGVTNDEALVKSLTDPGSYDNSVNNPDAATLDLSGPRMGYTFFTGYGADVIRKPRSEGGYNKTPAFFQMGYQFETQYLNSGNVQALFEFVPMVTGLDQGMFLPSFSVFNGIRSSKNGLEFAVGPSINFSKELKMWQEEGDDKWYNTEEHYNVNNREEEWKADSRGYPRLKSYIVLAAGYSFKSGKLNIPVNAYVVPSKDNYRFGVSFGFNARR